MHENASRGRFALARNDFDEFSLAVSGNTGNTNYFVRLDGERERRDRLLSSVIVGTDLAQL